jgi:hypothetical protein
MQKKVYGWDEFYIGVMQNLHSADCVEVDGDAKTITVYTQEKQECAVCVSVPELQMDYHTDAERTKAAEVETGCPDCDDSDDYNDAKAEEADVYIANRQGEVRFLSQYGGSSIVESFFDPAEARKEARRLNRKLKELLTR